MNEFDLIRRYFTTPDPDGQVVLGIGDDAAILRPSPGGDVHVSVDTLVSGRHFFADVAPAALGHKTLAVNLSDMAAMGARPRWALLALTLPQVDEDWLSAFASGLFALARAHDVALIGGDTTRGPLTLSVTVMGETPVGTALCRHGARAGDDVWVSGRLGLAALALRHRRLDEPPPADVLADCRTQLEWPQPRVALGQALLPLAHACIDVSDGLMADLGHILTRSGVNAEIWFDTLPTHPWMAARRLALADCLAAGGDDYELCFTAPVAVRDDIAALSALCPVTRIGRVLPEPGPARLLDASGNDIHLGSSGFDHFQDQA
ncbi:MAG: thiamine-phosphate kinase [Paludibacterium sp.]|uniref:thiamine-phosphate kinase n=1 Tax=Paludibacterium sp. TaxID=1917523 RepID=UPI0025E991D2|nr:thiamine-phosphate kinase [Paludibacterium sp.]MBV8045853.1 thiamine-phosphate kinase [Paludibacterium sp.]MBV8646787.1 thiamine-phosphate kinase [Paludibacterium sp.]